MASHSSGASDVSDAEGDARGAAARARPSWLPSPAYVVRRAALELGIVLLFFKHAVLSMPAQAPAPPRWLGWLSELWVVLRLERARRIDVLDAGGEEALAREPERLFRKPLPHLKQLSQLRALLRPGGRARGAGAVDGSMGGGGGGGGMADAEVPILRELVLIGGGHAHVHVLRMWGMRPLPGVRLTLVSRDVESPYSGMLPGHVAGQYTRDECHIDVVKLGAFAGARFVHAEATGVDVAARRVHLSGGRPPLRYDVLSINIGCTPRLLGAESGYDRLQREAAAAAARGGAPPAGGGGDGAPGAGGGASPAAEAGGGAAAAPPDDGVTPVKPIDGFGRRWDALVERVVAGAQRRAGAAVARRGAPSPARIAIVGGGGGGVELALAVRARLHAELESAGVVRPADAVRVCLVSRSAQLMPSHSPAVRAVITRALAARSIEVRTGCDVTAIEIEPAAAGAGGGAARRVLVCADGTRVPYDDAVWCTQGAPQAWLAASGLARDADGFLSVDQFLRVSGRADVFAAGDCASVLGHPRPKAGVFAVRMGMPLAHNLRAALEGAPLTPYTPQSSFLGLVGTGDGDCVASRGELALQGPWLWQLKDWIDRKWMWDYTAGLPSMEAMGARLDPHHAAGARAAPSAAQRVAATSGAEAVELLAKAPMRCGGCGAKVGSTVLGRAMARIDAPTRPELLVGTDAPDDCAVIQEDDGSVSVHSVDYFRAFIDDPFLLGRVAAVHALSDVHAMGAEPVLALATVTLPLAVEAVAEEDLVQLMAGACAALEEDGCALGGGHTCEGKEMGVGFTVTGRALSPVTLLRKAGMRSTQALILTKPLGTGVLFAAHMRHRARGRWVSGALHQMISSNGRAASVLLRHEASACTDVTGFGLCGHLLELCRASNVGATIQLDAVPMLDGAVECVREGIFSSLAPANMRLRRGLASARTSEPAFALLFDPQTAGGLLASVPRAQAEQCVAELRAAGYAHAAVIGEVEPSPGDDDTARVLCE